MELKVKAPQMETKICPYCGEPFLDSHGNSIYCPDKDCGYETRKIRSKKRYATISQEADPFWLNEKILRESYNKYGPQTEIDPNELVAVGFDFELDSEEKNINGAIVYFMRNFGYSFLKNKNIIIWKLR